uniref:Uncharacterized protein n=1 Tax=Anguilla anguilla TaxID=7936 RepID=A0A0E9X4C4_ANGAN
MIMVLFCNCFEAWSADCKHTHTHTHKHSFTGLFPQVLIKIFSWCLYSIYLSIFCFYSNGDHFEAEMITLK